MKIQKRFIVIISMILSLTQIITAQELTQTIKGTIIDYESNNPLIGATVVILETKPLLGAISDINGNFKIEKVPLGRYNIQITYVGYESAIVSEVLVTSGKEVIINTGMKQKIIKIKEVSIKGNAQKHLPLNTMATVSARSFTVEETRRYAGGFDDPARVVSAFAGVSVGNIQDNAIIVRGNSPKGVGWRLEGIDIPNPSHFSGGNVAGGGAVTIFSSQLLATSDFFTGAFPAEYGNALAGVFDIKLRTGNNSIRENTIQIGLIGIDISSEGPFKKGKNATYLFNYRYSTLGLISEFGILASQQIPKYQDLSFKLYFPTEKMGSFSLWGIGANDYLEEPDEPDSSKWETSFDMESFIWKINTAAAGLTHKIIIGKQTYINTTIAASGKQNLMEDSRIDSDLVKRPNWNFIDKSGKITVSTFINHKFNSKHTVRSGFNYHILNYNLDLNASFKDTVETFQNFVKENGNSSFLEFYFQSKYNINEKLSINSGINTNYFNLNNGFSIDPRFSIKWEFHPNHALCFGYGKHSQMEELKIYFINRKVNNQIEYPNKNLKFSHAQHFVLSYDWMISDHLRLLIEPYYQYLYNIPGIPNSSFSFINFKQDMTFREALTNNSEGKNIGIDFTLERFLNHNYYFLFTTSIFDSKYKADDGIWRNSRYDKGFVINLLLGKEFFMKNNKILGINGRLNLIGGERITPLLMEESLIAKRAIYNETKIFEDQAASMYYLDVTVNYRNNKKKHSGVWALQIKNILGSPTFEGYGYNYKTDKIERLNFVVILPVLSYKIEF